MTTTTPAIVYLVAIDDYTTGHHVSAWSSEALAIAHARQIMDEIAPNGHYSEDWVDGTLFLFTDNDQHCAIVSRCVVDEVINA